MQIDNVGGIAPERLADVADQLARLGTIGDLLAWARGEPAKFASSGVLTDVVVQDELTHDIVVALATGVVVVLGST
jgi:hypothetical protein